MKNRLEVAREFLRDDGVIFIQCDDKEQAYLKVLCDEIFGRDNFVNCVAVKMSETSGVKMSHANIRLPKLKEYILIYKRNSVVFNSIKLEKISNYEEFKTYAKYYSKIIANPKDKVENWQIISLSDYYEKNNLKFENDDDVINFKLKNANRIVYRTNNKGFKNLKIENDIQEVVSPTGIRYVWWQGKQMLFLSDYLQETLGDLWIDLSTINLNKEGQCEFSNAKKPEALLQRILELATNEGDLVMDFFAGSGTTLAVAMKMNRRFIGIEQMDYIESITKERLKKVIQGEQGGISKAVNWNGGGSFVYAEMAELNVAFKSLIADSENDLELCGLYEKLRKLAFIDYRVDILQKLESKEFAALSLQEKKEILKMCLDSNMDYIPLADINDSHFTLDSEIKRLNAIFYGGVK